MKILVAALIVGASLIVAATIIAAPAGRARENVHNAGGE